MSLKKPRIHITGISNVDYKSKGEIGKIFNNFKYYTIKPDKNNEPLDPTQVVVYKSQKPRKPNMYNVSLKEAVKQDGDSLLYANTYNLRKELKLKRLEQNVTNKLKNNIVPNTSNSNEKTDTNHFKTEQNKQSDEMRLKNLRRKVQDKLIPHKNIQSIFLSWQNNYLKRNELSVFELHKRINELGIPITYNETIGLISFANKRNTNSLNLDEFKNLFFVDSDDINNFKNISSIKIPENIDSKKIEDDYKKEDENKYKKYTNNKIFDNYYFNKLESMLHIKNSNFINSMNEINNKENNIKGLCDFQTFKSVLDTLKIPEKYKSFSMARSIFNEYKIENHDLMNYNDFIERCKNMKDPNNFFEFQNKYLNLITNKLLDNENKRNQYKDILLENVEKQKDYIRNLGASKSMDKIHNNYNNCITENIQQNSRNINNYDKNLKRNITLEYSNTTDNKYSVINTEQNNTINDSNIYKNNKITENNHINTDSYSHYQPSLNFVHLLFKDSKRYSDKYDERVEEFSPKNVMNLKKNKRPDGRSINCRFFDKSSKLPPLFMSYDSTVPGYISEKQRFDIDKLKPLEKRYEMEMIEKMRRKKNEINEKWNNMINFQQNYAHVKESLGQINRTRNLYEYENRNVARNSLEE